MMNTSDPSKKTGAKSIFRDVSGDLEVSSEPTMAVYRALDTVDLSIRPVSFDTPTSQREKKKVIKYIPEPTPAPPEIPARFSEDTSIPSESLLPKPNAEERIEERVREAEQSGFERGQTETREALQNELGEAKLVLTQAADKLEAGLQSLERSVTSDSVHLALMIAKKILGKSLHKDPERIKSLVDSALETTEGPEPVVLVCAPESAQPMRRALQQIARDRSIENWTVEENVELKPGDILIRQGPMTVDARLNTRLERIERTLLRELRLDDTNAQDPDAP